uniref:CARD domain-containing protein n=1 Tax=Terrapene triunguis TaxID=2587831 RepID=A0A674HY76_9SAUR
MIDYQDQTWESPPLNCMTEGRLNHILDVLRSQRVLSKMDYEMITSFPTLTSRARALLDTCLCLGEGAAQIPRNIIITRCIDISDAKLHCFVSLHCNCSFHFQDVQLILWFDVLES